MTGHASSCVCVIFFFFFSGAAMEGKELLMPYGYGDHIHILNKNSKTVLPQIPKSNHLAIWF